MRAMASLDPAVRTDGAGALRTGDHPPTGPLAQGREFVWTDADFSRVQALIYQRAGINLHDGKHAMVYSRLSRRLRETGHAQLPRLPGAGSRRTTAPSGRSSSTP